MALTTPRPTLRRLRLDAVSPAKVSLVVPPGDVLEVSEDVAAQLVAGDPHFRDARTAPEPAGDDGEPASTVDVQERPAGRRRGRP